MPRPPARRNRTVRNVPETASASSSNKQAEKKRNGTAKSNLREESQVENQARGRATTPERADHGADNHDAQRGDLTPTGKANENAIASSPAENTATTSIRPPTRARGYSSTLSLVGRKGDFNSRIGSTPGFESSILSNFKKRSRQPSLLQMMQADDDNSSDFDDDDFLGGFSPQDESTPLNVARASNVERQSMMVVSPSRPPIVSTPSSSESRKRKRQSAVNDRVEPGSPSGSSTLSIPEGTPQSSSSVNRFIDSASITMATPLSSSTASPARFILDGQEKQTIVTNGADGPVKNTTESLPKVTTSSIQSKYLPQRRIRRRQRMDDNDNSEDNGSFYGDSEEDELIREVMRRPQRLRKKALTSSTTANANAKIGNTNRGGKKNKREIKGGSNPKDQKNNSQRTYSRQKPQAADKENYFSDDSSVLSSPPPSEDLDMETEAPSSRISKKRISSRELEQQARKFAEVDLWEMEFEEVSLSETS